jgi:hypothetical protein
MNAFHCLFAVGERLPGEQIGQLLVGLADQRRPETGLLDAVFVPQLDVTLENRCSKAGSRPGTQR